MGAVLKGRWAANDGSLATDTTRATLAPLPRDQASPLQASDRDDAEHPRPPRRAPGW